MSKLKVLQIVPAAMLLWASSGTVVFADSQAQLAYDACRESYNNVFGNLHGYKAIVAGVTGDHYQCFWHSGAQSLAQAINLAMNACERKQEHCFVYADSNGHRAWSARIAANSGTDGSDDSGGGDNGAAASAFLNGVVTGFNIMNGGN